MPADSANIATLQEKQISSIFVRVVQQPTEVNTNYDGNAGLNDGLDWIETTRPVPYLEAVSIMEARVAGIRAGTLPECMWLVEHPSIYTAGTSAKSDEWLDLNPDEVVLTGRGGKTTWHGPGQRVVYVMLDLRKRGLGVRCHVRFLEDWISAALGYFQLKTRSRADRIGLWITRDDGSEDKIAQVGVRVRSHVSYHGVAINVDPDLSAFTRIVPCGIIGSDYGVTSLAQEGIWVTLGDLDSTLLQTLPDELLRAGNNRVANIIPVPDTERTARNSADELGKVLP